MSSPPDSYETLTRVIHDRFDEFSPTNQRIALFLTQNPNDVAVSSVGQLAEQCGSHASSLVRFAQLLGYQGFKEMQRVYRARMATAAPMCLAQALTIWLAAQQHSDDASPPRIPFVTQR